jgi:hypothetical protein
VRGKPVTVSTDRVKPAYVFNEADCGSIIFNPLASATPTIAPATQTTRSGRRIRFPARFNAKATFSAGGVMLEAPTKQF